MGACLKAPPLKEITWASEMKTRCARTLMLLSLCAKNFITSSLLRLYKSRTIDDMDSRMEFGNFVTQGKVLSREEGPSS
jgi:hypothetical protein